MTKLIFCLTAQFALGVAGAAAQPGTTAEPTPAARVSYAELNLSSAGGRHLLNGRIHRAAERLCRDDRVRDLGRHTAGEACVVAAVKSAQSQIARALAAARDGRQLADDKRSVVVTLAR
ncbi:MAG: UrcA family protein [Alphaproteobacteria bacterium]|nr:UrcA family protein [Alphaproteobacteria bacterium]